MKENLYFKELSRDADSYAGLKNQHLPQHRFCEEVSASSVRRCLNSEADVVRKSMHTSVVVPLLKVLDA